MKLTAQHYAWIAVGVFLAQIGVEVAHLATRTPWLGFEMIASLVVSLMMATIWLAAAAGMLLHREWGGAFGIAGALTSLVFGVVIVAAGDRLGLIHLTIGAGLIFLMKRASPWFGWRIFGEPVLATKKVH